MAPLFLSRSSKGTGSCPHLCHRPSKAVGVVWRGQSPGRRDTFTPAHCLLLTNPSCSQVMVLEVPRVMGSRF